MIRELILITHYFLESNLECTNEHNTSVAMSYKHTCTVDFIVEVV